MEQPAPRLPLRSRRIPPAPWMLQPFVHPQTFYPQGSANRCQLSRQEQPFSTPWAPQAGVAPQAPPKGLQMAPCGCRFDPNVFQIQSMTINLPSPAATLNHSTASLLGTTPKGSQGCRNTPAWAAPGTFQDQPHHFASFNLQGRAAVPAPPCSLEYQELVRRFARLSLYETTTTTGSNISPGGNVLSHCADPHIKATGDPAGDLPLPKGMLADCFLVSQDGPSRVSMPGYPGGTSRAIPYSNIASLSLPAELLTSDYSIPEASDSVLSLEQVNTIGMGPHEPWWDAGTNLPSPQLGGPEKRGQKRKSTFPEPPSKRRALAIPTRVGKWD